MKKIIYLTIAGLALLYSATVNAQGLYADAKNKDSATYAAAARTESQREKKSKGKTEEQKEKVREKKVTVTEDEENHIIYLEGRKDPIIIPKRRKKKFETEVEKETIEVTYRRETTRTKKPDQSNLEQKTETNYRQALQKQDFAIVDYIRKRRQEKWVFLKD